MKRLVVVAAFALAAGTVTVMTHQAFACDYGVHAANATPVILACAGDNCGTKPTAQEPTSCTGSNCAKPEPAAPNAPATALTNR